MHRLCTIKEIAKAAGVGVGTVHRVLKAQPVRASSHYLVTRAISDLNRIAIRTASPELIPGATGRAAMH